MEQHAATISPLIRYPPFNNSLLSSSNTKKTIAYEPRTEAISPAINDDLLAAEESSAKSTQDEQTLLVDKLKKVEAEILQTDQQIIRLRKQKTQLEQAASCASRDDDENGDNVCDTKQLSIAKLVYHENRAKAQKAHSKLEMTVGATRDLPLYNQPSDNAIYHFNAAKFSNSFKNLLIAYFKGRLQSRLKLEDTVSTEYNRRMENWLKRIEQDDSQPSKRVRDAKTREFFEKQFPELKKARESGERFSRVGQRVARSDAELDELLDGIAEREDQDKKVKSYAVIPPMLEEMRSMKPKFMNTNGYVEDIVAEYKEYQILNTWTSEEKEIFKENYLQHPKNFGLIATLTGRKSVADCVQYYYLSKKSENYKQLLKRQQKRRTRSFVRPAQQTPAIPQNETSNDVAAKANGFDEQGGDATMTDVTNDQNSTDQADSKSNALNGNDNDNGSSINGPNCKLKRENGQQDKASCCVCNSQFANGLQSRNVTRSNHQLYGIALDALWAGMKICYPCRFRHARHPSSDEPPLSPEPMDDFTPDNQMEIDQPLVSATPTDINSGDSANISNKAETTTTTTTSTTAMDTSNNSCELNPVETSNGPQRTCVRDIIYRAIEMSYQNPKPPVAHRACPPTKPQRPNPVVVRSEPSYDEGILDLSLPSKTKPTPPPQATMPQKLQQQQQHQLQQLQQLQQQQPQAQALQANPKQEQKPSPRRSPPPLEREISRSPNLMGSPASPSQMVIDESADVRSSAGSSDRDDSSRN